MLSADFGGERRARWPDRPYGTTTAAPCCGQTIMIPPDDQAKLKKKFLKANDPAYEKKVTGQARPNVIFEAGRAFGSHPNQTIIVEMGETRPFSDTGGIHAIRMTDTAELVRNWRTVWRRQGAPSIEPDKTG